MKRIIAGLAVAGALSLGGCGTTGGLAGLSAASVQQLTVEICGYLPTAATVAAIFASGNAAITTIEAAASAICAAVTPVAAGGRLRGTTPTVAGVVVHGRFVTRK